MQKEINKKGNLRKEKLREQYVEELISDVNADFERRRKERVELERQWELNMNFLNGNQYCEVDLKGRIIEEGKTFYWQNKEVFNHIAPIIDTRLAKFSRVTPTIAVRPNTDDDADVAAANLAEKLIESAVKETDLHETVRKVTVWSETCGTGFYKIVWDEKGGNRIGTVNNEEVFEGQVKVMAVSPFEIFPDSLNMEKVGDCESIIHARAMSVNAVKAKYGVSVIGGEVDVLSLKKVNSTVNQKDGESVLSNAVIVIERYENPSAEFPMGRLVTVAGDKLLYVGDLPYKNDVDGKRSYPFVKQCAFSVAGSFFGTSVIERLIPVQRAFNAVKNRKHEFMNRLSMGVMTVEDGSIDVDDLAEDGLSPGKVLVYRQGSKAPEIMAEMNMPSDFNVEEDKLLNEFVVISGVSNVTSSASNATLSSGSALEILVEQDNSRLLLAADEIRKSYVEITRQIIRLYAQFSVGVRAITYQDENNKTRILYADERAVNSDDVYLESENELLYTNRQKKEMIFNLYSSGILTDDEGKLRPSIKGKVLSLLGYKDLDYQKGLSRLHEEKASRENENLRFNIVPIDEIDEHSIHVDEHVRFVLCEYETLKEEQKQNFYKHIREHKEKIKMKTGEN